jgi:hypothetical protein
VENNPYQAPQKREPPWYLVPMREQPLLVVMLYFFPLALGLFLAMILSCSWR